MAADRPWTSRATSSVAAEGTLVAEYTGTRVVVDQGRDFSLSHQPCPSETSSLPFHQMLMVAELAPIAEIPLEYVEHLT